MGGHRLYVLDCDYSSLTHARGVDDAQERQGADRCPTPRPPTRRGQQARQQEQARPGLGDDARDAKTHVVALVTSYQRRGVNQRWDWGPNGEFSFVLKPDGRGLFYDFSNVREGETTNANDMYECSRR